MTPVEGLENVVRTDDGNLIQTLAEPLTFGDETVKAITYRRARGGDLLETDKEPGVIGKSLKLASVLSGRPMHVFKAMDAADVVVALELMGTFLGSGQSTGSSSSPS